ncbi:amino acid ABC transporter substrate-binding protein [Clostridiisalibacter paucivorans]|uniref:amino acid ABC transporter substrate-binding protein n=1 Tax=Clostridiisalibacter paucivorans TaxID=408753 RepID=UPI00054F5A35|nr:amino acid ABC transporter substrate-binding protein [Clostridiisalibacter paucivorans]
MNRKKYLLISFVIILSLSVILTGCGEKKSVDNSLNDIKEKGYFVVGLDDSFPPMGFRDNSGEIVGFDIDLAKAVAEKMGVDVKFQPVEWDGVVLSLKKGDIDVIWNGLTVTEEREENIDFSDAYLANRQAIIVGRDSEIKDRSDLKDKIVGIQMGSSSEKALASDDELTNSLKEVRKYSNNVEALLDLKAGRLEAVIVDEIVGRYYTAKKQDEYKILEDYLAEESYAVGVREEDDSFTEELNKILKEIKEDGTGKTISEKWFGEDILVK